MPAMVVRHKIIASATAAESRNWTLRPEALSGRFLICGLRHLRLPFAAPSADTWIRAKLDAMRLAKVAVASVSPTVGGRDLQCVAAHRAGARDGRCRRHDRRLSRAGHRRLPAGGPRAVARLSRRPAPRARALRARDRDAPTVFVLGLAVAVGGQLFNAAAIVHRGRILGFVPKEKLPTYNVFYEARTFSHGGSKLALDAGGVPLGDYIFRFDFGLVAIEVCEDAWSPDGPMRRRCYSGAEIVVNVSSSPYRMGIDETRREMLATRAADNQTVLIYANAVGGQDGLIFDGGGLVFQNGRLVLDAPRFREGWASAVVDLDRTEPPAHGKHDVAHRLRGLPAAAARRAGDRVRRRDGRSIAPRLSGAGGRQLLPAAVRDRARSIRAIGRSTISSRRSRSASGATSRRPARSGRSASRCRAAATRC